jgi:hypothetical protein
MPLINLNDTTRASIDDKSAGLEKLPTVPEAENLRQWAVLSFTAMNLP